MSQRVFAALVLSILPLLSHGEDSRPLTILRDIHP